MFSCPYISGRVPGSSNNNHFSSKSGSSPLFGAEQQYINGSADQRQAQAAVVNAFVDQALAAVTDARVALIGDFNEFSFLAPLQVLAGADDGQPVVTDLLNQLTSVERYTYVFEGNSQALDHLFTTSSLAARASVDVLHINSEFADQVSDHDPIVARFDLSATDAGGPEDGGDDDAPVDEGGSSELAVTEGSGGCTMGDGRDASLPILLLLATIIR